MHDARQLGLLPLPQGEGWAGGVSDEGLLLFVMWFAEERQ
jgi:hypothetical protein